LDFFGGSPHFAWVFFFSPGCASRDPISHGTFPQVSHAHFRQFFLFPSPWPHALCGIFWHRSFFPFRWVIFRNCVFLPRFLPASPFLLRFFTLPFRGNISPCPSLSRSFFFPLRNVRGKNPKALLSASLLALVVLLNFFTSHW